MAGIFVGGQSVFVLKPLRSESLVQVVLLEVLGRYVHQRLKAGGEKSEVCWKKWLDKYDYFVNLCQMAPNDASKW